MHSGNVLQLQQTKKYRKLHISTWRQDFTKTLAHGHANRFVAVFSCFFFNGVDCFTLTMVLYHCIKKMHLLLQVIKQGPVVVKSSTS